jgi:hypothetical protein
MSTPGPGQLLFAFVRHWSRGAVAGDGSVAARGRLVMVTEAVAALTGRNALATLNASPTSSASTKAARPD